MDDLGANPIARLIVFVSLLLGAIFAIHSWAVELALISAKTANIYREPNGEITDKLPQNTAVVVGEKKGEWAQIQYLSKGDLRLGWVQSKNLKAPFEANSTQPTRPRTPMSTKGCSDVWSSPGALYCLQVSTITFDCEKNLFDDGFKDCSAEVPYWITSNYNADGIPSVTVSCRGTVKYETADDFLPSEKSESKTDMPALFRGRGPGKVNLTWSFSTVFGKVTRAKLTGATCQIDSVLAF